MYSKISVALTAAVLSPLLSLNPAWAAQKSMERPTVAAADETGRDKSYPGWKGFQPFEGKRKEGGNGQPGTSPQPQGEGQPGQPATGHQPQGEGQPGMERQEGQPGTGSPGGATGGNTGTEGGSEGGQTP